MIVDVTTNRKNFKGTILILSNIEDIAMNIAENKDCYLLYDEGDDVVGINVFNSKGNQATGYLGDYMLVDENDNFFFVNPKTAGVLFNIVGN